MVFYTYLWLREDGTPYYVGKGSGRRSYEKHGHRCAPPEDRSRILVQEFPDETMAFLAEKFLIAAYGRKDIGTGCLWNLTDGGEQPPSPKGRKLSDETKKKISQAHKGNTHCLGHRHSEETRAKIGMRAVGNARCLGRKHSKETREKIRASVTASHKRVKRVPSEDARAKTSASMIKYWREKVQGECA